MNNKYWSEHLIFSITLGGVTGGVFSGVTSAIPSLSYKGPAPSYAFGQWKPSYFGINSWKWTGKHLLRILGNTIIRKTLQLEFVFSATK